MKGFWSKKLPAFLLALVMVAGMMPAALAAHTHQYPNTWQKNDTQHWRVCTVSGCGIQETGNHVWDGGKVTSTASCYQTGTRTYTCTVCGYTRTETIPTTAHNYDTAKWDYSTTQHWHPCTTPGCSAQSAAANHTPRSGSGTTLSTATCTSAGSIRYICSVCGVSYTQTIAALGHTDSNKDGRCDRCNAVVSTTATSGTKIIYEVEPGDTVDFDRADFSKIYQQSCSGSLRWVSFYDASNLKDSIGTMYYDYDGSDEESLTRSDMLRYDFYYSSDDWGTYPLSGLTFAAADGADGKTVTLAFQACGTSSQYAEGTVEIRISDGSSSGTKIVYDVDEGDKIQFDRADFNRVFQEEYSSTVRWVTFTGSTNLKDSIGTLYYDYDGRDEVAFTSSSLTKYDFYYNDDSWGSYPIDDLTFVSGSNSDGKTVTLEFRAYYSDSRYVDGTVEIRIGSAQKASGDITYTVDPGDEVDFDADDFNDFFQETYNYDIRYVTFTGSDGLKSSNGTLYASYGTKYETSFTSSTLTKSDFYYDDEDYGSYALDDLTFVAADDFDTTVTLEFRAYYSSSRYVDGKLVIRSSDAEDTKKGDINYSVAPEKEVCFNSADFNDFFRKTYNSDIRYVTFTDSENLKSANGVLYFAYDTNSEKSFTSSSLKKYTFYYSDEDYGDYDLDGLSFVAAEGYDAAVTLEFRAYYSDSRYVDGTVVITPTGAAASGSIGAADIRYYATYNTSVQINANDIARFFSKQYPGSTLQYVKLDSVPSSGSLYYNYYSTSSYGSSRKELTDSTCDDQNFYFSPSSTSQYSLSELTYVPYGLNYCVTIPFTAYGSGSRSVKGTILISVTMNTVSEVYGVTPKNTAVSLPSSAIFSAVSSATGTSLAGIQLLALPSSSVGALYVGTGNTLKASTGTRYSYSSGTQQMSQLRFVPASGYTGSVEIPYVAYNSSGNIFAAGKFCLGVVASRKQFSDVPSSSWCYKYVTELSSAGVIGGYADGTFRPNDTVTYGAALKLIMLAAGYAEQKPTDSHIFSGYLSKAKNDGLVSGNVDLNKPITRLAVSQIAAKALRLDISNLSDVKPFTDTADVYVQALNAAGIVEGYFSNGTSTFKPSNTLTRGQVAAIVWRMQNYNS